MGLGAKAGMLAPFGIAMMLLQNDVSVPLAGTEPTTLMGLAAKYGLLGLLLLAGGWFYTAKFYPDSIAYRDKKDADEKEREQRLTSSLKDQADQFAVRLDAKDVLIRDLTYSNIELSKALAGKATST